MMRWEKATRLVLLSQAPPPQPRPRGRGPRLRSRVKEHRPDPQSQRRGESAVVSAVKLATRNRNALTWSTQMRDAEADPQRRGGPGYSVLGHRIRRQNEGCLRIRKLPYKIHQPYVARSARGAEDGATPHGVEPVVYGQLRRARLRVC